MSHLWGTGDEIAVGTGLAILAIGMSNPKNRTRERAALCLANGIALGPLLLILASPFPQLLHLNVDLLEIAVSESRVVIFWAAFIASLQLLLDIF